MRDIVPKVSADRPTEEKPSEKTKISQYINHFEMPDASPMKMTYDMDQESVSSQDSGTSSNLSGKSDVPTYRSYQKYLNGYSTLKFKPVKPGKLVEAFRQEPEQTSIHVVDGEGKPPTRTGSTANNDDARTHKAEIMIQVKSPQQYQQQYQQPQPQPQQQQHVPQREQPREVIIFDIQTPVVAPPPPPPPPAMPHVLPARINAQAMSDMLIEHNARLVKNNNHGAQRVQPSHALRTCLLDELKAKHPPKEYQCHDPNEHKEVERGTYPRRTSEPINTPVRHNLPRFNPVQQLDRLDSRQQAHTANQRFNSLPRRFSEQTKIQTMLSNPEAQTVTRVPAARPNAPVDRADPSVKKLVYATLRNYVGAYNSRANLLAAQHDGHVVQDKGVAEQIKSITASGNLSALNGRTNPKESE